MRAEKALVPIDDSRKSFAFFSLSPQFPEPQQTLAQKIKSFNLNFYILIFDANSFFVNSLQQTKIPLSHGSF